MNRSQATSQKVDSPKLKGRDSQNPRITTDFIAVEKQENAFKSRRKEFESKAIKNSDYTSGSDELSPIGTDSRKFQQKKAYVGTPVLPIVQKSIVSSSENFETPKSQLLSHKMAKKQSNLGINVSNLSSSEMHNSVSLVSEVIKCNCKDVLIVDDEVFNQFTF